MRNVVLLTLATAALLSVSAGAEERHQSYFTYEDGGTVVVQSEGKQNDARTNFPVFPGDEIRTSRRGRAEVRMADGNIVDLDRSTALRFHSILDSYEGESSQTVAELVTGQVIVHRIMEGSTALRLDTKNASYLSSQDASYGLFTDSKGRDVVSVYDGSIEVRMPSKTTRLRAGELANVDDSGIASVGQLASRGISDFESWSLKRPERYTGASSSRLDSSLAYASPDLDANGSWVYVGDYGSWAWRPYVSAGWRPYYDGQWTYSPGGGLVWVSYEPWGWVPYHYGRWSYAPSFGWVWNPGYGYSHAWVYWAWGASYIGWAPAGWYDCYTPYYGWAYQPYPYWSYPYGYGHGGYGHGGYGHGGYGGYGFGFYGSIQLGQADLAPWTFVTPTGLVSGRVDRAALTTNAIRDRLVRDGDRAAVSRGPQLTRDGMKDPASTARAIARGIGGGTGKEGSGSTTDLTPFFRRDPELSADVRGRVTRPQKESGGSSGGSSVPSEVAGGSPRGGGGGTVAGGSPRGVGGASGDTPNGRIVRGGGEAPTPAAVNPSGSPTRVVPGQRGNSPAPGTPAPQTGEGSGGRTIPRTPTQPRDGVAPVSPPSSGGSGRAVRERPAAPREQGTSDWRSRGGSEGARDGAKGESPQAAPAPRANQNWRSMGRVDSQGTGNRSEAGDGSSRGRSVPRTVIEGIGGPRVTPRGDGDSSRSGGSPRSISRPSPSSGGSTPSSPPSGGGSIGRSPSGSGSPSRPSSGSGSSRPSSGNSGQGRVSRH